MESRALTIVLLLAMTAYAFATRSLAQSGTASPRAASAGAVERKLEPGGKIRIRNSSGSVTITNSDRDTMRAEASGGGEAAELVLESTSAKNLLLSVTPKRGKASIDLAVSLPRDAMIESVDAAGNVYVTDIAGSVTISSGGDIIAEGIGGDLVAKTIEGSVKVSRVRGLVDLSVVNGGVTVRDAGGDVRVASINGGVDLACVGGRVDVGNVNGSITLMNIGGDVEAATSNSPVEFTGAIRAEGRYRLKSHSGFVEMRLPSDAPGFTATLSSYRGGMETDFPLAVRSPFSTRRLVGRYREGGASRTSIHLDSFGGGVKLAKTASAVRPDCRE